MVIPIPYRQNIPALRLTGEIMQNTVSSFGARENRPSQRGHIERKGRILLRGKREKSSKSGSFGGTYVYAHFR